MPRWQPFFLPRCCWCGMRTFGTPRHALRHPSPDQGNFCVLRGTHAARLLFFAKGEDVMRNRILSLSIALLVGSMPNLASACACGCGVFDVGTGTMLPTGTGGKAWLEFDFMNQDINW